MKTILYSLLFVCSFILVSCEATIEDKLPGANVSVEELTESFTLVAETEGNNNITVELSPTRYVKVYSAENNSLLAEGTNPKFQVAPPTTELGVYITTINSDGSLTKSSTKNITVTEYTNLPAIYDLLFAFEDGKYGTTKWTWDDSLERFWGNGSWGNDTTPTWWGAPDKTTIESQCIEKGLPNDGIGAWFTLSLNGVETSRGEKGFVNVSEETIVPNWGVGTLTFTNTIPLLGVLPNDGNKRCFTYQIISLDETHMVLASQSLSNSGEGWFFCYKRID